MAPGAGIGPVKTPGRRVVWLLAASVTIIAVDALALATGSNPKRLAVQSERRGLEEALEPKLNDLSELQDRANRDREAIVVAMDALNRVLNLGRVPESVDEAAAGWGEAQALMEHARPATVHLPAVTGEIVELSETGSAQARRLMELGVSRGTRRYLEALATALGVMVETQRAYSSLNTHLIEAFPVYEDLFRQTSEYFTKIERRDFRTRREAADWYTLRTEGLIERMVELREQLAPLNREADEAGIRAREAFSLVERVVGLSG